MANSDEDSIPKFIAIDFGAESGRFIVGKVTSDQISMEEIYRFRTQGTPIKGELHWNVIRFWEEVLEGLRKYHQIYGPDANGIGIDTWGVSMVGLDKYDHLRYPPFHYRANMIADPMLDSFKQALGEKFIFDITGIQFMGLNSSTHFFAMNQKYPDLLKQCATIFMMPDLFYFWLTGQKITEYSNASTTQLLDANQRIWSPALLKKLGLNPSQFPPIYQPGTTLGELIPEVQELTQLNAIPVHVVATHDTGSAIAAIPHTDPEKTWAYLSSGTWSLLGVEIPEPLISDEVRHANLTNEGGVNNTIRFLKNIMGMWLIQRCKAEWDAVDDVVEYSDLTQMAEGATPFQSIIYPDDPRYFNPKSMIHEIQSFCEETNQLVPQNKGEIARCIFESLACRYREVLETIEALTGTKVDQLHIVGGGSRNQLLSQMTADVLQKEVITGPVECTAIGNIMMQAKAAGLVDDLPSIRQIVKNSFPIDSLLPGNNWDEFYEKYLAIRRN